ncbi:MAG: hypothetical protein Q8O84_03940, partial [Nanoarchaeota archaeon]|nr:hypothetical protein [Nanoarchaeota archaeon]
MVYKKYIKRGDKLFGPYYYRSVKKDGKVITQYVKNPNDFPRKIGSKKIHKNFLILPILFLILIAGFFILKPVLTGKATLSADNSYVSGETLFGELKLNLEPREFIPADTKVIINEKEFILKNLIQENPRRGEFYVSGVDISGFGEGYGVKEEDLEISFVLNVLSESPRDDSGAPSEKKDDKEISKEDKNLEAETNETGVEENNETIKTEEIIEETTTETETPLIDETLIENTEEINNDKIPEVSSAESGITGNFIKRFFSKFYLAITGKTSLENINEVSAKVSKDNPFVYALEQGQTAEIKDSSKKVNLEIINDTATITTDYSGEETEYLINLSELNIPLKQNEFEIKLIYNDIELASIIKNIKFESNETNQTAIQEINLTADESLIQYGAVLGEPVKWKKKITASEQDTIVELPKEAENISIYRIETSSVIAELNNSNASLTDLNNSITGSLILSYEKNKVGLFNRLFAFITGRAVEVFEKTEKIEINISENNGEYDIEYITPGPTAFEKNTSEGKEITISSEVHYENILAFTNISENKNLEE